MKILHDAETQLRAAIEQMETDCQIDQIELGVQLSSVFKLLDDSWCVLKRNDHW